MTAEPPTKFHLKFLSSTEGRTGSSESTLVKVPHCWKSRVAAHFFKNKVMIIVFLKWANDTMLLMVMEMRMSDWTDFVGVISVCFNVQVPSVLFCLIWYEVIWMFIIVNVNQSKRFEFLIKIWTDSKMILFSASVRFGFPYNSISSLSGRKFLKELNKTKRWIVCLWHLRKLTDKQCGPRSDCSCRSSLIWVHNVCLYAFVK